MKNFSLVYFILSLLTICTIQSCHDDFENEVSTKKSTTSPNIFNEKDGSLVVYIYDENLQPIADALVTVYNTTGFTDANGVKIFKDVKLDEQGSFVKVEKQGYIIGSDMVYATGGSQSSRVMLLKKNISGSFQATQGGVVTLEGGGQVSFSPNSIVTADGQSYQGLVQVTAKHLSPDDQNLGDKMPGALFGLDEEGKNAVLGTAGMVAVELFDESGNKLNIANGKKSEVLFPIANSQASELPQSIALWSFDFDKAMWIQEGEAIKDGNNYVAEVSHFSFWNCDAPFPLVHFCTKVLCQNGMPATGVFVTIEAIPFGVGTGYPDNNGVVCGKIPKAKPLVINVKSYLCPGTLYTAQIGPFDNDVILDDIIIDLEKFNVAGTVKCNTDAVTDAYLIVKLDDKTEIIDVEDDGTFSFTYVENDCNLGQSLNIRAINSLTGEASEISSFVIDGNDINVDLNICYECDMSLEIISVNSDPCNTSNTYEVQVMGGQEPYTYQWDNGQTDAIAILEAGTNCVTVTDQSDPACMAIKCIQVEDPVIFELNAISNPDICNGSTGSICFSNSWIFDIKHWYLNGVELPLTDGCLVNLSAGTYLVEAEFEDGCTVYTSVLVESISDLPVFIDNSTTCDKLDLGGGVDGSGNYEYNWTLPDGSMISNSPTLTIGVPFDIGIYCLEAIDLSSGCSGIECITIDNPGFFDLAVNGGFCDNYGFEFTVINDGGTGFELFIFQNNVQIQSYSGGEFFTFYWDFIKLGNTFSYNLVGEFCQKYDTVILPNFEGNLVNGFTPASSDTAADGSIDASFDPGDTCNNCTPDQIVILQWDENSGMYTDVTSDNGNYTTGTYYVVIVNDKGCPLGSEKVEL
ncbi:MAG: hypothetical protein KDC16_09765 [Saprospiraceae bacterium]|nr:hypothetical protein [Saprospiraceae bacterium]